MLGAPSALVGREFAVRVNLAFEAVEEGFPAWRGAGITIGGAAP
jgi:hypothetical protein